MSRLLTAEWKRLWARRMTRFFPAAIVVLLIGGIVIAYFVIENDEQNVPNFVADIAGGIEAPDVLGPLSALLPIMAYVIGASSIGADSKTGMLEQLLTWEPRRLRLLAARVIAGGLGVAVIAAVLAALMVALLYGLAATAGTTNGTSGEFWTNTAMAVLRTGVASGLFAIFGIAITLLVDSSVGSIVGFLIYSFIIENVIGAFLPKVAVYTLITNADAFGGGRPVQRVDGSVFSDNFDLIDAHSYLTAGLILLVAVAVGVMVAGGVFRVRDID
ncbi:MAG: ABC-2 type transport system permease protein [Acidimicrobiales bacterium]